MHTAVGQMPQDVAYQGSLDGAQNIFMPFSDFGSRRTSYHAQAITPRHIPTIQCRTTSVYQSTVAQVTPGLKIKLKNSNLSSHINYNHINHITSSCSSSTTAPNRQPNRQLYYPQPPASYNGTQPFFGAVHPSQQPILQYDPFLQYQNCYTTSPNVLCRPATSPRPLFSLYQPSAGMGRQNGLVFEPPPRDRREKGQSPTSTSYALEATRSESSISIEQLLQQQVPDDQSEPKSRRNSTDSGDFTKLIVEGCLKAEGIATRNQHRPCFKNIKHLCTRTRTDILKPSTTVSNIHSQGVPWVTKDFIFAFVRLINSWYILKGYLDDHDGCLGKIEMVLQPEFKECFRRWQDMNREMISHLVEVFVNLDSGAIPANHADADEAKPSTRCCNSKPTPNTDVQEPCDFECPKKIYMKPGSYRVPCKTDEATRSEPDELLWKSALETIGPFMKTIIDDQESCEIEKKTSSESVQAWVDSHNFQEQQQPQNPQQQQQQQSPPQQQQQLQQQEEGDEDAATAGEDDHQEPAEVIDRLQWHTLFGVFQPDKESISNNSRSSNEDYTKEIFEPITSLATMELSELISCKMKADEAALETNECMENDCLDSFSEPLVDAALHDETALNEGLAIDTNSSIHVMESIEDGF